MRHFPVVVMAFMRARLVGLFDETVDSNVLPDGMQVRASRDVVEACLDAELSKEMHTGFDDLFDLRARILAVQKARGTESFSKLATAFKRAAKITKDVPCIEPDVRLFDHSAEKALWEAYTDVRDTIQRAMQQGQYDAALETASSRISEPMDTFFDKDRGVFVMSDDLAVRDNRLRLLATIVQTFNQIARLAQLGNT